MCNNYTIFKVKIPHIVLIEGFVYENKKPFYSTNFEMMCTFETHKQ